VLTLPPRYRCPLDRLQASRLLPPRSGLERSDFVHWPITTLPQEFMSAMPPKADKPERTCRTQSGHAIERSSLDRRQCYVLDGLRKSFLGRSKTAVSGSPREQCHLWITAVGSQLISLTSSGL
jgi:hypothetical protein